MRFLEDIVIDNDAMNKVLFKDILLEVFEEFIRICEENSLQYFCLGGTLLGAIRHQGIIPWDDDIDVGMPRADYEKFLAIFNSKRNAHFSLIYPTAENNFYLPFAKVYANYTKLQELNTECMIGVFVDVFPLDGISSNDESSKNALFRYIDLKTELWSSARSHKAKAREILKKFSNMNFQFLNRDLTSLLFKSRYRERLLKELQQIATKNSYESSSFVCNFGGAWASKEISTKEEFSSFKYVKFEHLSVRIPIGYHKYLTRMYGDYMVPPTEVDRASKHVFDILEITDQN